MTLQEFLDLVAVNLPDNTCCASDEYYAQWGAIIEGSGCLRMRHNLPVSIYEAPNCNPSQIWLVRFENETAECMVLVTKQQRDAPATFSAEKSLSLSLAEHDINLDLRGKNFDGNIPVAAPLDLLRADHQSPRLLPGGPRIELTVERDKKPGRLRNAMRESLGSKFEPWLNQIDRWESDPPANATDDRSIADLRRLRTLANNLHYEVRWGLWTFCRSIVDRYVAFSSAAKNRVFFLETRAAFRRKSKTMPTSRSG